MIRNGGFIEGGPHLQLWRLAVCRAAHLAVVTGESEREIKDKIHYGLKCATCIHSRVIVWRNLRFINDPALEAIYRLVGGDVVAEETTEEFQIKYNGVEARRRDKRKKKRRKKRGR